MYAIAVLLTFAALAFASSSSSSDEVTNGNLVDRLDLKNYKHFASEREDTTTSSSDSSSDAKRIARAVEAALKEAALAEKFQPQPAAPATGIKTFRTRLSTTNKANTCATFDCQSYKVLNVSDLAGASVTVTTPDGTFTARFNSAGVANNPNDFFQFTVQATLNGGEFDFQLSTVVGEFGVNVSSITVTSQAATRAVDALVYFNPLGSAFWDEETNRAVSDAQISLTNGTSVFGCDATFDGHSNSGVGFFTVTDNQGVLVTNETAGTFTFSSGAFAIDVIDNELYKKLGLAGLPCANRPRAIYDEILIVTKRDSVVGAKSLEHPFVYDELKATTTAASTNFDRTIQQFQLAAGRTQLRLRDITLDRGAFSDLSHTSKFTPCFRVYPDVDGSIEIYIGLRTTGADALVFATLDNDGVPPLVDSAGVRSFDSFGPGNEPKFTVKEVAFSTLGLPADDSSVLGEAGRPYLFLDSDVSVTLEECPEFSYFA
jgi:hypothetical protein